eukprot:1196203-Prorocentrum_minimum.AAC.9
MGTREQTRASCVYGHPRTNKSKLFFEGTGNPIGGKISAGSADSTLTNNTRVNIDESIWVLSHQAADEGEFTRVPFGLGRLRDIIVVVVIGHVTIPIAYKPIEEHTVAQFQRHSTHHMHTTLSFSS